MQSHAVGRSRVVSRDELQTMLRALPGRPIIVSDFDGTIAPDHEKEYMENPRVRVLAIEIASREGHYEFVTATGSRVCRTIPWAELSRTVLLAEHGNVIYDPKNPSEGVMKMGGGEVAAFIVNAVAPVIEHYLDQTFPGYVKSDGKYTMLTYHMPESAQPDAFMVGLTQFVNSLPADMRSKFAVTFSSTPKDTLVDIMPVGTSKSNIVKALPGLVGFDGPKIVMGDGEGDIPLFEAVLGERHSLVVIPANAQPPVIEWTLTVGKSEKVVRHGLGDTECVADVVGAVAVLKRVA